MSFYVILRGPLGVGKTTVATALARSIEGVAVSIDAIADPDWDGGSLGLYLRANRVAARRARDALARGTPVVIDGCFYWKTQLRDLERRLPFAHTVITLRAPLSICVRRDAGRAVVHGAAATRQVYRKVTRLQYGLPVDASRGVAATVREVRSLLPDSGARPSRA